jgi:hypothetical protein
MYEGSALCRDLDLTTHNNLQIQTSMAPAEFEPAIPSSKRPPTHALDRAVFGIVVGPIALIMQAKPVVENRKYMGNLI